MQIPRIVIAAPRSGSGKTLITSGLLAAMKKIGHMPCAYKCGPDYIDPMFHKNVIALHSCNLDSYFLEGEKLRALFCRNFCESSSDIAIIEGVMGLYDGMSGVSQEGSTYHIAQILDAPIVLVVNAKGMGRSVLALIAGFLEYDIDHRIKGVILNQVSESYCNVLKPLIEDELQIMVLGCVPTQKEAVLEHRHLGLVMPDEIADLQTRLKNFADGLHQTIAMDKILEIAKQASAMEDCASDEGAEKKEKAKVKIAIAKDEAFCFYYDENLRILKEAGAELVDFSPIHDEKLPDGVSGVLLGGGYPELFAKELSANERMKASIREAIASDMPSVAECGGFLYLHAQMKTAEKAYYPMVGVIPATCEYKGKLGRFGYIEIEDKSGRTIRAHEFHYFDSEENGTDCVATKPLTGRTWECVHCGGNHWWGFPHLYYGSNPEFAKDFVEKAADFHSLTR